MEPAVEDVALPGIRGGRAPRSAHRAEADVVGDVVGQDALRDQPRRPRAQVIRPVPPACMHAAAASKGQRARAFRSSACITRGHVRPVNLGVRRELDESFGDRTNGGFTLYFTVQDYVQLQLGSWFSKPTTKKRRTRLQGTNATKLFFLV